MREHWLTRFKTWLCDKIGHKYVDEGWVYNNTEHQTCVRCWRITSTPYNGEDGDMYMCKPEDATTLEASHAEILSALEGLLAIVKDSQGVSGFHLNGDVAEWEEFPEVEQAFVAVAKAREVDDELTDREGNSHGISCLTCRHKHIEVDDRIGSKERWLGCAHPDLMIETAFDMVDAKEFFCARHSDKDAVNRMLLADDLLDSLIEADNMIGMEPYEHVAQEASEAHENIRETIRKAKGEGDA